MISMTTPMTPAAACPAAAAAPRTAVIAVTRLRAQETSALVQAGLPVLSARAGIRTTGLTVVDAPFGAGNAPVQGPPSRGTPV